ncbi:hypothetical protein E5D57_013171 [Metarhizium anisopliae]|nr:hypothetical protein E5D57_013171 [Metarhizium anisopliae]
MAPEGEMNQMNGMPGDGMVHPSGMVPVQDGMNEWITPLTATAVACPPPVMGGSQPYGGDVNSMNGHQMQGYNVPPGQNGMPIYGTSNSTQPRLGSDVFSWWPKPLLRRRPSPRAAFASLLLAPEFLR